MIAVQGAFKAVEIMEYLRPQANFAVRYKYSPGCKDELTIGAVWVISTSAAEPVLGQVGRRSKPPAVPSRPAIASEQAHEIEGIAKELLPLN